MTDILIFTAVKTSSVPSFSLNFLFEYRFNWLSYLDAQCKAFALRCDGTEDGVPSAAVPTPRHLWHPHISASQVTSRLGFSLLAVKVERFRG
jgi:hypothetical protein